MRLQQVPGEEIASPEANLHASKPGKSISVHWCWGAVIGVVCLLWLPRLSGPIDLRWDGGVYYLLGTSLANGHGYRIPSEPGTPEAIQYPPLLPVIVALHERALGTTDPAIVAAWLRRSYAATFTVFAVTLLALARRLLPNGLALLATVLCLCQVMTVFMSDLLFTELPFALLGVLFVLVGTTDRLESRPFFLESLLFGLGVAGFLLRTAGVALLGAWVLDALLRRRWRVFLFRAVLSLLPVLAWQAHVAKVRSSAEYTHPAYEYQRAAYQYYNVSYAENIALVDPFRPELGRAHPGTLASRLVNNVFPALKAVGETVSTKEDFWSRIVNRPYISAKRLFSPKLILVPICALSAITLFGLAMLARGGASLLSLIVLLSLALAATTPWPAQFSRYLMPIAPFLAICLVEGWRRIPLSLPQGTGRSTLLARLAMAGTFVVIFGLQSYALIKASDHAEANCQRSLPGRRMPLERSSFTTTQPG